MARFEIRSCGLAFIRTYLKKGSFLNGDKPDEHLPERLARDVQEDARRLDLERRTGIALADLLTALHPGLDLVELGLAISAEGQRRENARAWGDE
jgi:hypothetical protein